MTLDSVWDPSWGRVDHSGKSLRTLAVVSVGNQPHQLPVLSMEHKASLGRGDALEANLYVSSTTEACHIASLYNKYTNAIGLT